MQNSHAHFWKLSRMLPAVDYAAVYNLRSSTTEYCESMKAARRNVNDAAILDFRAIIL